MNRPSLLPTVGPSLGLFVALLITSPSLAAREETLELIGKDAQEKLSKSYDPETLLGIIQRYFALADTTDARSIEFEALRNALQYSGFMFGNEDLDTSWGEAFQRLIEDFSSSEEIADIAFNEFRSAPPRHRDLVAEGIEVILEENEHARAIAACLYAKVQRALESDRYRGGLSKEERLLAIESLQTLEEEYGDIDHSFKGKMRDVAKKDRFELENLFIGAVAPDIEGVDLDGVPFKLSDYRGKVILLDFWGHW